MTELQQAYDVVIIGGGMAALCLVRLIQRELPGASVLTLDKGKGPSRKVGESTVEIAGHFLHTRLDLHDVLSKTQLPKYGIRYWFDSAEQDQPFDEASEDGPASFSWWQTYQLERDTFEQTLLDLNTEAGSPHLLGAQVQQVDEGEPHRVRFEHDGQTQDVTARWLVDASGPRSPRGQKIGLLTEERRIPHGSTWGWFKGGRAPEQLLSEATCRRRFCFGRRVLSTNSYMAEGYWVWMIPLASGLLSVGVVYDINHVPDRPKTRDEFVAFLNRHRMLRDTLEDAELVDFGQADNFAQKPSHYLAADRTAWIGTAAGLVDPLYSGGLDFIAIQCEYIVDLLRREGAGEGLEQRRIDAYNGFLAQYFEQTVRFFSGLYKTFVSQELVLPRYRRDVHIYWLLYTWPYFSEQYLDPEALEAQTAVAEEAMARTEFFARLLSHAYEVLGAKGKLHRRNKGRYTFNQLGYRLIPWIRFERQMGRQVSAERQRTLLKEIDPVTYLELLDVLFDGDRSPMRGLLYDAVHEHMDTLVTLADAHGFDDAYWAEAFRVLSLAVRAGLAKRGVEAHELTLSPETWPRVHQVILAATANHPDAKAALAELPLLDDLHDLPPIPSDDLQAPIDWGEVPHTPWPIGKVEKRTVYDFLGEAWWTKPMSELPAAVWGIREV